MISWDLEVLVECLSLQWGSHYYRKHWRWTRDQGEGEEFPLSSRGCYTSGLTNTEMCCSDPPPGMKASAGEMPCLLLVTEGNKAASLRPIQNNSDETSQQPSPLQDLWLLCQAASFLSCPGCGSQELVLMNFQPMTFTWKSASWGTQTWPLYVFITQHNSSGKHIR